MARVSIYVSDELKARMVEAGDALNWSDIARPVFEAAIANHNHRKGQNMQTAIERLRASKQQHMSRQEANGKEAGRHWAANKAQYDDLKRLAAVNLEHFGTGVNHIWQSLKSAIDPENDLTDHEVSYHLFDENDVDEEYMIAFAEGAQEFFAEVESEI